MTVKELIDLLSNYDEDTKVAIECDDCEGKWYEVDEDSTECFGDTLVISVTY